MRHVASRSFVAVLFAAAVTSAVRPAAIVAQTNANLATARDRVQVPFVGCKSDGQTGPLDAPGASDTAVWLDGKTAARLTVYQAQNGLAVLGPRGWSCFGLYGSAGSGVIVAPSLDWNLSSLGSGIPGFAIHASLAYGDTSGRFQVAEIVARVFPAHKSFADKVAAEGIWPPVAGVFPADHLTYRSDRLVEYETPARAQGLGTFFQLLPNGDPIRGVVMLTPQFDVLQDAVRLPQNLGDLSTLLIQQFETQNASAQ
jgi:hypothetical protein